MAESKKNGFCFTDTQFEGFGRPSMGPWSRTYRGAYNQTESDVSCPTAGPLPAFTSGPG